MTSFAICEDIENRMVWRVSKHMRGGGGVPSCDAVSETWSGTAKILRCVLGCSVCTVFVSSPLVSSDGALAIGVGDLDSQTERMANSE